MKFFGFKKDNGKAAKEENQENGGRNLCILGFGALIIAIITTSISLKIYHDTGDIYLDRSRPGFISEDEKNNKEDNVKETFSDEGEINSETLDEYLESLEKMRQKIDVYDNDFSSDVLTDFQLNIEPIEENSEETSE